MKFSSVSFIAVVMRPLASSHFGKSVGGISVSPVLVCVCFDLYNDDRRPTDETSLHHWPANRRRYDVIHRQDVHPTVEWTLPKTFNPDNCKQQDSFGTPRSDLTGDSLNDQTQWSCSSRCYPIFGHLSCSSLGWYWLDQLGVINEIEIGSRQQRT